MAVDPLSTPLGYGACFFAVMLMSLRANPHSVDQPLARVLVDHRPRPRCYLCNSVTRSTPTADEKSIQSNRLELIVKALKTMLRTKREGLKINRSSHSPACRLDWMRRSKTCLKQDCFAQNAQQTQAVARIQSSLNLNVHSLRSHSSKIIYISNSRVSVAPRFALLIPFASLIPYFHFGSVFALSRRQLSPLWFRFATPPGAFALGSGAQTSTPTLLTLFLSGGSLRSGRERKSQTLRFGLQDRQPYASGTRGQGATQLRLPRPRFWHLLKAPRLSLAHLQSYFNNFMRSFFQVVVQGAVDLTLMAFVPVFAQSIKGCATAALVCGFAHSVKTKSTSWLTLASGTRTLSRNAPYFFFIRKAASFVPGTQEPHTQPKTEGTPVFGFVNAGAGCYAVKTSPPPLVALAKSSPPSFANGSKQTCSDASFAGGWGKTARLYAKSSHKRRCQNHLTGLGGRPYGFRQRRLMESLFYNLS